MLHFFSILEKDLQNHPGTSIFMIFCAVTIRNAAEIMSAFSVTYSFTFNALSLFSVSLVILCHWRKGYDEARILRLKIKGLFCKLTIKEKIKKFFTKKGI